MAAARPVQPIKVYSSTVSGHAHAPEGNVSLEAYRYVRAWLTRVEALPGFIPMAALRMGLNA